MTSLNTNVTNTATTPATTTTATTKKSSSLSKLTNNFDNFLTILTAQLKNQDPLSPTDTHQFTNQLVLFSQAEQQVAMNDKLDKLLTEFKTSKGNDFLNYVGKDVKIKSQNFQLDNKKGSYLAYKLPDNSRDAKIQITNEKGLMVLNKSVKAIKGEHTYYWDGKDSLGKQLPNGKYKFNVVANDLIQNKPMKNIEHYFTGLVNGVTNESNNKHNLLVNGGKVDPTTILSAEKAITRTPPAKPQG